EGNSQPVSAIANGLTDLGTIQIASNVGVISGTVTTQTGKPALRDQITLTSGSDVRTASTDATGVYQITGVAPGPYTITAVDLSGGLRAKVTGTLPPNQSATVNLVLTPSGTIKGTAFGRNGVTPVASGVNITLTGPAFQTTTTDGQGQYSFDFVPLGNYTIQSSDATGNQGRTAGSLLTTSQVAITNVTFLGQGQVAGQVQNAAGNPVANASVTLVSQSIFPGQKTTTSDATGHFSFSAVFVGGFQTTASSAISRLGGQSTGSISSDGQSVNVTITLSATGSLSGTVFRSGGVTPVAGAAVRLSNGMNTVTDAQGHYSLNFVPVGSYAVNVTDSAPGDRGTANATIASQDQLV